MLKLLLGPTPNACRFPYVMIDWEPRPTSNPLFMVGMCQLIYFTPDSICSVIAERPARSVETLRACVLSYVICSKHRKSWGKITVLQYPEVFNLYVTNCFQCCYQACKLLWYHWLLCCVAAVEHARLTSGQVAGTPESGWWSDWQVGTQDQRTSWGTEYWPVLFFLQKNIADGVLVQFFCRALCVCFIRVLCRND